MVGEPAVLASLHRWDMWGHVKIGSVFSLTSKVQVFPDDF